MYRIVQRAAFQRGQRLLTRVEVVAAGQVVKVGGLTVAAVQSSWLKAVASGHTSRLYSTDCLDDKLYSKLGTYWTQLNWMSVSEFGGLVNKILFRG